MFFRCYRIKLLTLDQCWLEWGYRIIVTKRIKVQGILKALMTRRSMQMLRQKIFKHWNTVLRVLCDLYMYSNWSSISEYCKSKRTKVGIDSKVDRTYLTSSLVQIPHSEPCTRWVDILRGELKIKGQPKELVLGSVMKRIFLRIYVYELWTAVTANDHISIPDKNILITWINQGRLVRIK